MNDFPSGKRGEAMERPVSNPAFEQLLSRLGAETLSFPHAAADLRVRQTHISVVLLAGDFAYKIKKPVHFPFVDYSTLEKRQRYCGLEVELNRRLSPGIYLGVVPLSLSGTQLEVEGKGVPVEYAVKMRRLPDERRLGSLLETGRLPEEFWAKLAAKLDRFYRGGAKGPQVSVWASPKEVEEDWRQILGQTSAFPPEILDPTRHKRLEVLTLTAFGRHRNQLAERAKFAREGHGDLRLEHIYYFPENDGGEDLEIIDCLEFNPRYRCGDPLGDIAFLAMDLDAAGFQSHSRLFTREFLKVSGTEASSLLDFYVAYRHLVRGLVRGLQAREEDSSPEERAQAAGKARLHFRLAVEKLENPRQRPCLLLLGGLPGAGKSTLGQEMARREGFHVLSSDAVRKELAGQTLESENPVGFQKGIYKPEWTEKTYAELLRRAEEALRSGQRVLVDASFWRESMREPFCDLAQEMRVPFLFFVCMAGRETIENRLGGPRRFGSDADLDIYRKMAPHWETPSPSLGTLFVNTERPVEDSLNEINRTLGQFGLAEPEKSVPVG